MSLIGPLLQTPHTFAVVGATQDPAKYGYEVCEVLRRARHTGLPINPKYTEIDDLICHPSLPDLLHNPDVVLTAAPAASAQSTARLYIFLPVQWL